MNLLKMKLFLRIAIVCLALSLIACATGPAQPWHSFSFDGRFDKWATEVDLLAYSYGDQYQMVRDSVEKPSYPLPKGVDRLPYQTNINGPMPVGEFLYVKWRIKSTGEVIEDKVDLRNLLPRNMFEHKVTFVIDGRQLIVYLVTPTVKHVNDPPLLRTTQSRYNVTYEIYPTNTYKQ